jgi:dipeptidyl aminopeptidase/acylaminoacyl peptidase
VEAIGKTPDQKASMRTRISALLLFTVFLTLTPGATHAQGRRPLNLDDLASFREVTDPQRSPEGQWVAYVVTSYDFAKDKKDSDVWMVSWDGSRQVRLTSSPDSEENPRWSPDGRYLAFTASRGEEDDKKKGDQVWLLDRSGGEAQKLTDVKGDVSEYAWSPDGKRLVLAVDDPDPNEAAEKEKKDGKPGTKPPIVIDRYHFKQDKVGYLGAQRTHLYLFDIGRRAIDALTSGVWDEAAPEWSPDGHWIAFTSRRGPDPDRSTNSDIWMVEAKAGATPRQVTASTNPDGGRPAWSPDGKFLAYLQGDDPRFYAYNQNRLAIMPVAGGTPTVLTGSLDRSVSSPEWSSDGKAIFFLVEDDRAQYVARVPASGGAIAPLTAGRGVAREFSLGTDGRAAVLAATAVAPFEIYALEAEGAQLRKLSAHNDGWLGTVQLATVEDFTTKVKDGTVVNGLLFKPPSFTPGTTYPTLLNIHGGPNGQDEHAFDFEGQWLAANGYVVLQVNYRGSAGRGSKYQKAIFADWGHLEVVDLIAGVDYAIAQGIADPARLGIGGWSYGGILTNYTIATDARFKAAVSGASSSLQTTMYGVDQYIVQYEAELGPPWKNPDGWKKVSYPFFHADRIKTPTLFLCGEKDFNVPIAGVEQMYQALRSLNVDAQLVIYPEQFHTLTTPSYLRDRLQRYVAWYDKYLKPNAGTPTH